VLPLSFVGPERYFPGVPDDSLDAWFQREILPHEAALVRYLSRVGSRRDEVHDLRQEIYVRVYESARRMRPANARAFLFTAARNLMTDHLRRGRVVSIDAVGDPDELNVMVDELTPERRLGAWQELKRAARALNRLPAKCREIVWLRKVEQLSNKQIAGRLGLSVRTVEGQMLKGMRLLADAVFSEDEETPQSGDTVNAEVENERGE
jgi:RNA polymerase sigma-70 factor (ECF subfamily)